MTNNKPTTSIENIQNEYNFTEECYEILHAQWLCDEDLVEDTWVDDEATREADEASIFEEEDSEEEMPF